MNNFLISFLKENGFKQIFNSRSTDNKTIFWLNSNNRNIPIIDKSGAKVRTYKMLYREFACNWILCAVFDYIFPDTLHSFREDDGDGTILGNGLEIITEHVIVYDYKKTLKEPHNLEILAANNIIQKMKKGGTFEEGKRYLNNKILVVNIQFPGDMVINIATIINLIIQQNPPFMPIIYFIGVSKEVSPDNFIYNVSQVYSGKIMTFQVDLDLKKEIWSVKFYK